MRRKTFVKSDTFLLFPCLEYFFSDNETKDDENSLSEDKVLIGKENNKLNGSSADSDKEQETEACCNSSIKNNEENCKDKNELLQTGTRNSESFKCSVINHVDFSDSECVQNSLSVTGRTYKDEEDVKRNTSIGEEEQDGDTEDESDSADVSDSSNESDSEDKSNSDSEDSFEAPHIPEVVDFENHVQSPSLEEDWDEEIENSLGPYGRYTPLMSALLF